MVSKMRIGIINKIIVPLAMTFVFVTVLSSFVLLSWFKSEQLNATKENAIQTASEVSMLFDDKLNDDLLKRMATAIALSENVVSSYIVAPKDEKIVASSHYRHARSSLQDLPKEALKAYFDALEKGTHTFSDTKDGYYVLAFPVFALNSANINNLDYVLLLQFNNLDLRNKYKDYRNKTLALSLLFLLVLFTLSYLLLHKTIRMPIYALQQVIRHQANAKSKVELEVLGNDEFLDLADEFLRMREVEKQSLKLAVQAADEAQRLVDKKSQFLANMSHEIRTPINGILGLAQLSQQSQSVKQIKPYLVMLTESTQLLLTVVNDVLDYSKLEKHGITIHKENTVLSSIIRNLVHLVKVVADRKHLNFHVDISNLAPYTIWADGKRLQQVLLNILNNAIKFTEHGSVTLSIDFEWRSSSYGLLQFSISDTGIGISLEDQKSLFKPFEQADNSVSRNYGGTGLGLTISKELVELMDGDIRIQSSLGDGSTFVCTVPCEAQSIVKELKQIEQQTPLSKLRVDKALEARAKFIVDAINGISRSNNIIDLSSFDIEWDHRPFLLDEQSLIEQLSTCSRQHVSPESLAQKPQRQLKVLLAEDNEINATVQANMLEILGCVVSIATNGQEALEIFCSNDIDLIIMDVQMPTMDGIEATKLIRAQNQSIPILGLSANTFEEDREQAFACGMNEYLHKPILQEELKLALRPYFSAILQEASKNDGAN